MTCTPCYFRPERAEWAKKCVKKDVSMRKNREENNSDEGQ